MTAKGPSTLPPRPGNVGREVSIEKEWTPLEALAVALRAIEQVENDFDVAYGASAFDTYNDVVSAVKVALASQFVKEGVK